jgi:hypothetical protein
MANESLAEKVDALIDIIDEEVSAFEALLELLNSRKGIKRRSGSDNSEIVSFRVREKIVECRLLSLRREKLLSRIKSTNSIEGNVNAAKLVELGDKTQGDRFLQTCRLINSLNNQLNRVRTRNAHMLDKSCEQISRTLSFLSKINCTLEWPAIKNYNHVTKSAKVQD